MKLDDALIEKIVKIVKQNVMSPDDVAAHYLRGDLKMLDLVIKSGDSSQSILVENVIDNSPRLKPGWGED